MDSSSVTKTEASPQGQEFTPGKVTALHPGPTCPGTEPGSTEASREPLTAAPASRCHELLQLHMWRGWGGAADPRPSPKRTGPGRLVPSPGTRSPWAFLGLRSPSAPALPPSLQPGSPPPWMLCFRQRGPGPRLHPSPPALAPGVRITGLGCWVALGGARGSGRRSCASLCRAPHIQMWPPVGSGVLSHPRPRTLLASPPGVRGSSEGPAGAPPAVPGLPCAA